jgi:hypothetical protein
MMRLLLFVILIILPVHLRAETISVVSGEHADFSRLVFQYPDEENWTISRFDDGYILDTASDLYTYNVTMVFDFIPRTRILKLENVPDGTLKIFTQEGFHLDAFDLRSGRLVIDIKDGLPASDSKFEFQRSIAPEKTLQADTILTKRFKTGSNSNISSTNNGEQAAQNGTAHEKPTLAEVFPNILNSTLPNLMDIPKLQPLENKYFSPDIDPLHGASSQIVKMEENLLGQIGRAVAQGLLNADLPDKENAIKATNKLLSTRNSISEPVSPSIPSEPKIEDKRHVRVQTAVDRDLKPPSLHTGADMPERCPPDDQLAIETWGEPLQDGLLLSEFRSLALGEFDQSLTEGVEKLAKYYLYLSFGAEAKMVLNEFGVFVPNSKFLRLIADVMDKGYSDSYDIISDHSQCPGATGFWAMVAREDLGGTQIFSSQQVVSYFSGLPLHLRQHLGPRLSEQFLSIGDVETAKLVQNALTRVNGVHGDAFDLLRAEMQLSDGDISEAIETLNIISNEDGPSAAEALIRGIDIRITQNQNIDRKTAELAEILAIEHRGTPLEESLTRVSILARIASGDPDLALTSLALPSIQNVLNIKDQKNLINAAALKITKAFNDLEFAKEAVALQNTGAKLYLTDDLKMRISERMLDIGFVDLASQFADFKGELSDDNRLLLGQISKRNGNYQDALTYVLSINEQEAASMRAELYLELGMPHKAAKEFTLADQTNAADAANFLAENWTMLTISDEKSFVSAAEYFTNDPVNPSIETKITISAAQNLIEQSQSSRAIFDDLIKP